jgi:hypothetical protein
MNKDDKKIINKIPVYPDYPRLISFSVSSVNSVAKNQ